MVNRNKKKINSKQANQISLIISAIYFICIFIKGLVSKPVGDFAVYYCAIGCVTGTIFVYFIFYFLIFIDTLFLRLCSQNALGKKLILPEALIRWTQIMLLLLVIEFKCCFLNYVIGSLILV